MKAVMMDHVMDTRFNLTRFELQYKAVTEFKWSSVFLFTGNLRLCQLRDGSWVHGSLRQHGQGNQMVNTPQLSMSITTMEGEIVDANVRLNQLWLKHWAIFQNIVRHNWISRGLGYYSKTGMAFIGLTWLLVAKVKEKVLFQARILWNHMILSISSHNQ